MLRRPLAEMLGRAKRVEIPGLVVEMAEVEQARESVEQGLAQAGADGASLGVAEVDELISKAAELGWHLGRVAPDQFPAVRVDRSGERPVVQSLAEERLRLLMGFDRVSPEAMRLRHQAAESAERHRRQ